MRTRHPLLLSPHLDSTSIPNATPGGGSYFPSSAALGLAGLFGKGRSRATAIAGLVLSLIGVCLFVMTLALVNK
jgi:hypothetical protein